MAITVRAPNGVTIKFPDGTDQDTIRAVMQKATGGQQQTAEQQAPPQEGNWLTDVPTQLVRGFNQGLNDLINLPGDITRAGARAVGIPYPDRWQPLEQFMTQGPEPTTTAGRYAEQVGQVAGGSAIPVAGTIAAAPAIVAQAARSMPATSTAGQIVNNAAREIAARPGQAVALDAASATTGGISMQAAEEAGYGPTVQALAGIAGGMAPALGFSYAMPNQTPIGTQRGRTIAQQRADEGAADLAAFERQEVRPFGPAFNQGPVASVGKQLTETPFVGAPLRNNLEETYGDAAAAVQRIADDISPNASLETAGVRVQAGLDRFRDRSFSELEPSVVRDMGINPQSPVGRQQGGGQTQLQRIQQGTPLVQQITGGQVQNTRGQPVPLPQTRVQQRTARTTLEDLSDAELGRVIRTPADRSSFSTRMEALYERAYRGLPPLMRQDGSRDPLLLPTANSGAVIRQIVGDEARTGIRAGLQGRYGQMFDTLSNPRANIPLQTLRAMRTAIGRELSNFGLYEASLDRTQLRRMYAALSSDIEVGMQDIAVRAAQATALPGNRRLPLDAARRAAQSLRDIQLADRYARAGFERMDRFLQTVRAPNPQQAAASLIRAATDTQGGNMRLFRSAMSALRPEERAEFGALIVRELGRPTASARGLVQETDWSFERFLTAYRKLSPQAREMVFTPQHHAAIEDIARIANRMANVEALANTSRSGTNTLNVTGTTGALASVVAGDIVTPALIGGSGFATSVLMSRPAYARWMAQYMRLRANVRAGTNRTVAPLFRHVAGLERMAQENPALWPVYFVVSEEVGAPGNPPTRGPTQGSLPAGRPAP